MDPEVEAALAASIGVERVPDEAPTEEDPWLLPVGVVGAAGCGKSWLVAALARASGAERGCAVRTEGGETLCVFEEMAAAAVVGADWARWDAPARWSAALVVCEAAFEYDATDAASLDAAASAALVLSRVARTAVRLVCNFADREPRVDHGLVQAKEGRDVFQVTTDVDYGALLVLEWLRAVADAEIPSSGAAEPAATFPEPPPPPRPKHVEAAKAATLAAQGLPVPEGPRPAPQTETERALWALAEQFQRPEPPPVPERPPWAPKPVPPDPHGVEILMEDGRLLGRMRIDPKMNAREQVTRYLRDDAPDYLLTERQAKELVEVVVEAKKQLRKKGGSGARRRRSLKVRRASTLEADVEDNTERDDDHGASAEEASLSGTPVARGEAAGDENAGDAADAPAADAADAPATSEAAEADETDAPDAPDDPAAEAAATPDDAAEEATPARGVSFAPEAPYEADDEDAALEAAVFMLERRKAALDALEEETFQLHDEEEYQDRLAAEEEKVDLSAHPELAGLTEALKEAQDAAARAESMARQVGAPGEYAGEDSFRVVREALGLKGGVT